MSSCPYQKLLCLAKIPSCPSPKLCRPVISTEYGIASHRQSAIALARDRHVCTSGGCDPPTLPESSQAASRNLALRQQLAALKRRRPRPKLVVFDKIFWVLARRFWSGWKQALIVVTPETVVRWHRSGFALYWRAISKARRIVGRKRI